MRRISRTLLPLLLVLSAMGCGASVSNDGDGSPWVSTDAGPDAGRLVDADEGPALRIDNLDPEHGPFRGGTEIILRGRGFAEGMTVTFDGRTVEALDLEVIDDRRAVLLTPPGDPGPADVAVETGGLTASAPGAFTYESIYVDPPEGAIAGGTWVVVRGFGTSFQDGDTVTFDGVSLLGTTVLGEQEIAGYTPPGVAGGADVVVSGPGGTVSADDAFTYTSTGDPFQGGLSGGPIMGAINITVVNAATQDGVPSAFVTVGDPTTSPYTGFTDGFGQITFSAPALVGPVTVTAGKEGFERAAFVVFDAQDVSIFLLPLPDPMPGTFPPGRAGGIVRGSILFGGPTGLGTETWDLVPEPRTPTEWKRAYVYTTLANPFSSNPNPGEGNIIDYVNDGSASWSFEVYSRPAALAVYAVAGLWDEAIDPDGDGPLPPGRFEPFALGAARGVLVGSGEIVENVDVLIDIPLDTAIQVELVDPPPLATPGWVGPTEYQAQAFVNLGGEGVIAIPGSRVTFAPGAISGALTGMAPITSSISDSAYTMFAGAYSPGGANPYSVRVVHGVDDLGAPVVIGDFLGIPRAIDPPPSGEVGSALHLQWAPEEPTSGEATFSIHRLQHATDGTPLWRIFARGDQLDIPLYDLVTTGGVPPTPSPDPLFWTLYTITIPGGTFDTFTYRQLNSNYWSAYAVDVYTVSLPAAP